MRWAYYFGTMHWVGGATRWGGDKRCGWLFARGGPAGRSTNKHDAAWSGSGFVGVPTSTPTAGVLTSSWYSAY